MKKDINRNTRPRHLARSVAKHNMVKAGMTHINSCFANCWCDFVRVK